MNHDAPDYKIVKEISPPPHTDLFVHTFMYLYSVKIEITCIVFFFNLVCVYNNTAKYYLRVLLF